MYMKEARYFIIVSRNVISCFRMYTCIQEPICNQEKVRLYFIDVLVLFS